MPEIESSFSGSLSRTSNRHCAGGSGSKYLLCELSSSKRDGSERQIVGTGTTIQAACFHGTSVVAECSDVHS